MLGKPQNNSKNELIILKIATRDADKKDVPIHFEAKRRNENKEWVPYTTGQSIKDVSGSLTKVELYEKEWEGVVTPRVKLYLADNEAEQTYLLDLSYTMVARSLFNSILSLEDFDDVEIGVWDRKVEDKTYPSVSVKQRGEKVNWKFKIEEQPKIVKQTVGKKVVTDSSELDEFFKSHLGDLALRVAGAPKKAAAPVKPKVETAPEVEDDIPF